jgi:alkanesulfonate monooxygenase SsuD/methylene tetrahydromethanopterin reductase-like flavin-dependent oxidoreductase (luciferase family)
VLTFSIFLSYQRIHPPEAYAGTSLYQEKLVEAKEADELGYDLIWVPEHHLIHFMSAPSTFLLATQIGLNVNIRVGTMVSLLVYRHPLISAGEIALTDQILEGRLELGVGRGAYEYEFERMGIPFAEGKERFAEALRAVEHIWSSPDGAVKFDGDFWQFDSSYVWPQPVQQPHPPLWYAAMSEPSIQMAAAAGYHVTNWPFLAPMSRVAKVAETFHAAREEAGGQKGEQKLGILRGAWVAETEEKAREQVETALVNHRINQRLHHFTQRADPRGYVAPEPLEDEPTADEVYENLIMGTPEQCLEKLEQYTEVGVDQVLLMFDFGAPHEQVVESMRLFAEQVIRPYRERHGIPLMPALAGDRQETPATRS